MSTINVRPSRDAAGSAAYVLYGHGYKGRVKLLSGELRTRAGSFAIRVAGDNTATPLAFVERAQALASAHGRKNQLQSYVLAFSPDEFDVTKQEDLDRIRDVAVELAERMHSADFMVVVHADSAGKHGHAHVLVTNHDDLTGGSLQRYTAWKHGLRQLNDELMRDEGLQVLPDPEEPKPDWELRREAFKPGGFEQVLGDKVLAALIDSRSANQDAFEQVLAEHGVALAVTNRDGWSYKMRRDDNGKLGRKKASGLTPEFTAEGAQQIFDYHAQKGKKHGSTGSDGTGGRAASRYSDAGGLDLRARRRQAADREADEYRRGAERVYQADGRGADEAPGSAVDLAAARAALDGIARRRGEDQAERDRKHSRRSRSAAQRERTREAARRIVDEEVGPGSTVGIEDGPHGAGDHDLGFG